MYKNLFFDLDNTLWDFDTNAYFAAKEAFDELGLTAKLSDFDEYYQVYEQLNHSLWSLYRERKITKSELTSIRFKQSLEQYGCSTNLDGPTINDCFLKHMPNQTRLVEGALEVLEKLASSFSIHIITNGFTEVQSQKLKSTGLDRFIGRMFTSEGMSCPKPQKLIFEYALKTTNSKKSESIMIGDSWESDIIGATNFGFDAIYFQPEKSTEHPPIKASKKRGRSFQIQKLEEIFAIVK